MNDRKAEDPVWGPPDGRQDVRTSQKIERKKIEGNSFKRGIGARRGGRMNWETRIDIYTLL